jgi:hypothetical protein
MLRVAILVGFYVLILASLCQAEQPSIVEQVARIKPGTKISVEVLGPETREPPGIRSITLLKGCLGPVSTDSFVLTGTVNGCERTTPTAGPVIRFGDVRSIKRRDWRCYMLRILGRRSF